MKCKHCEFIEIIFKMDDMTNREYWLMTEIFVYLHNDKDFCNGDVNGISNTTGIRRDSRMV
jgi:hypothetical protein